VSPAPENWPPGDGGRFSRAVDTAETVEGYFRRANVPRDV